MLFDEEKFKHVHDLPARVREAIEESGINVTGSGEIEQKREELESLLEGDGIEAEIEVDLKTATLHVFVFAVDEKKAEEPVETSYLLPVVAGERVAEAIATLPGEIRLNDLDKFVDELKDKICQNLEMERREVSIKLDEDSYSVQVFLGRGDNLVECKFPLIPVSFAVPQTIGVKDDLRGEIKPVDVPSYPRHRARGNGNKMRRVVRR